MITDREKALEEKPEELGWRHSANRWLMKHEKTIIKALEQPKTKWLPIEQAPRDSRNVLLLEDPTGWTYQGWYAKGAWRTFKNGGNCEFMEIQASHFQHLPPAPED